jgi:uncharacterized membrane protein
MAAQARSGNGTSTECCQVNVGDMERQASMWGGTLLAACGLLKGSMSGLALAAIGAALIYRGHTGHCHLYEAFGHSTAEGEQQENSRRELMHRYA